MKQNKTKLYAKALAEVLSKPVFAKTTAGEERKIIDNFLKFLKKNGDEKKAKEILNLAEDFLLAKQGKRKVILETARKMTADQKKLTDNFINDGDKVHEKINPELIAGIKIIINDSRQFDNSMLSKLNNIL